MNIFLIIILILIILLIWLIIEINIWAARIYHNEANHHVDVTYYLMEKKIEKKIENFVHAVDDWANSMDKRIRKVEIKILLIKFFFKHSIPHFFRYIKLSYKCLNPKKAMLMSYWETDNNLVFEKWKELNTQFDEQMRIFINNLNAKSETGSGTKTTIQRGRQGGKE